VILKAYMVYNVHDGWGELCFLTYAETRNQARAYVSRSGYGEDEYVDLGAVRKPDFDKYALRDTPHIIETNDYLPAGVSFYAEDEKDEEEEGWEWER